MNRYDLIIIGGGVAGMQAAITAAQGGLTAIILEKENELGGKVAHKNTLFPTFTDASEVINQLLDAINECGDDKLRVALSTKVVSIDSKNSTVEYIATNSSSDIKSTITGGAILLANGYTLFDATLKQEYGYKVYNNVITSYELEEMMKKGKVECVNGKKPSSIAFIHCVGSRDSMVGNEHCSRVCCVTGVKQAIELTQLIKGARVFNFYMDIRMFGNGYEEMYKVAQERNQVRFIRGRVSEISETIDGGLRLKAEDTLIARPLAMTVDMVVLLVGMCKADDNALFAKEAGLELRENGYFKSKDSFTRTVYSGVDNIFYAGCAESPKNVSESINQATIAALSVVKYLKG